MTTALLILAAVCAVYFAYTKYRKTSGYDINVPTPSAPRNDLLYGFYGCETGQVEAVRRHTNMHWECQWHGPQQAADDIISMRCTTVLDVSMQIFDKVADHGKNFALKTDADVALLNLFDYLRLRKALQYVKVLVPLDEPNTNCRTPEELMAACQLLKAIAVRYSELDGVKLACIYAAKPESFTCIEQFDWVGVDDYDAKSSILDGSYKALVAAKRPEARTILLPGGAFGQNPTPFINFAHNNLEVVAVVPFCWFGPREPADKWVGIGDGPQRMDYIIAGRNLTGGREE